MKKALISNVITVRELLATPRLTIPVYQRPYRWTEENITDLFTDLSYQTKRLSHNLSNLFNPDNTYRLGTIVLHQPESQALELVDGQQRTLTLMLIMLAAMNSQRFAKQLDIYTSVTITLPNCSETHKNLSKNLDLIKQLVDSPEFTAEVLDFLLNHCELVIVKLYDLPEAFQFFDSQNARGLDLSPHDLLKAFHLREFPESESNLKKFVVDYWEQQNTRSLKQLFSNYLYPIRRWSVGQAAMHFSKANVDVFKGVNVTNDSYRFQQGLKIIHNTVDNYNKHFHRGFDEHTMPYPFQLTQTVINGRRFFEWVTSYQTLVQPLLDTAVGEKDTNWLKSAVFKQADLQKTLTDHLSRPTALTIFQVLDNQKCLGEEYSYSGRWRQGDQYVRRMFDALVLSYYDRFGEQDLPRAIEYIFIWSYSLRLKKPSVYLESVEKHIREDNVFMRLQYALSPVDFLNKPLQRLIRPDVKMKKNKKGKEINKLKGVLKIFEELGYCTPSQQTEKTDEQ